MRREISTISGQEHQRGKQLRLPRFCWVHSVRKAIFSTSPVALVNFYDAL